MDRVGLIIDLIGKDEALSGLKQVKSLADDLNKRKVQLTMESANIDRQIASTKRVLDALINQRWRIKFQGGDVTAIESSINNVRDKLADLTMKKRMISVDAKVNNEAIRQTSAYLQEAERNAISLSDVLKGIGSEVFRQTCYQATEVIRQ